MAAPAIPSAQTNNIWFARPDSDTVVVFIHGIFSDSRGCWLHEVKERPGSWLRRAVAAEQAYWPSLIYDDPEFQNAGIYLAGYFTAVNSTDYDLAHSANEIYVALNRTDPPAHTPVMSRKNIIFVGHSTGGIVARYILERYQVAFREKNVGVVLIASPSKGSLYANKFDLLTQIYKNELGGLLKKGSIILDDLDDRFSVMVHRKEEHIPNLIGAEACEHHFIFRRKLLPARIEPIVDEASAGRYFPKVYKVPDSDHFSVVKPPEAAHHTHNFLRSFWQRYQKSFLQQAGPVTSKVPVRVPPKPQDALVGRGQLLSLIEAQLLAGNDCAIYGESGTGKSFVTLSLAHDADIRNAFPDGVLYDSFGEPSAVLAQWGDVLGLPRSAMAALRRPEDRAVAIANAIGDRKMLLVCDDCDSVETALLFRLIGRNCARILTTQHQNIAETFTKTAVFQLPVLSAAEAVELLHSVAPALRGQPGAAERIIGKLGTAPGDVLQVGRMLAGAGADPTRMINLIAGSANDSAAKEK